MLQVVPVLSELDGIFKNKKQKKIPTGGFSWLSSQLAETRALLIIAAHHSKVS